MPIATLQDSGDQFLFGADDENDEGYTRDFGEDKDQLISQLWDDADVEKMHQWSAAMSWQCWMKLLSRRKSHDFKR